MTVHLPIVSVSELRAYRRCQRLHQLSYGMRYRSVDKKGPRRFGSAWHRALEVYFAPATCGDVDAALASIDVDGEIDPYERAKCRAMILGYHARWGAADLEILAVEVHFRAPLVNPATGRESFTRQLGGQIDVIVRTPDGRTWIMEHKSTSEDVSISGNYWRKLRMDAQLSTYFVGARGLGYECAGAMYDAARKPGLKPYKKTENIRLKKDGTPYANTRLEDETPEEYEARCVAAIAEDPDAYLHRGIVTRSAEEMREAAADTWDTVRMMRESELAGRFPRNDAGCEYMHQMCDFFDVCTGFASLDDTSLFRVVPREDKS